MKKLATACLLLFVAAATNFAQTVVIKPKKTVYTRKGKDVLKEKRTLTITYPLFNGTMSAAAKKNLEKTISYWHVFETTLQENLEETWLYNAFYKVNYNKNGILDIALTQEGAGAYPDESTVNFVIDLKTGEQVKLTDVFKTESLATFAETVNAKLEVEKKEIIKAIGEDKLKDNKEANDWASEQINELHFIAENFNEYSVSDKGVTILYDAGFPHAIQAAQPAGRYFFTWAEAKPFIRRDGLLAKFVR